MAAAGLLLAAGLFLVAEALESGQLKHRALKSESEVHAWRSDGLAQSSHAFTNSAQKGTSKNTILASIAADGFMRSEPTNAKRMDYILTEKTWTHEGDRKIASRPWAQASLDGCRPVDAELQLKVPYKVAVYWKNPKRRSDADITMILEGILDHPMLTLERDLAKADYVLYNFWGGSPSEEGTGTIEGIPKDKVIAVDWADGMTITLRDDDVFASFRRSIVQKSDGAFTGFRCSGTQNCFPIAYGILNQYLDGTDISTAGIRTRRQTSLLCSLRPWLAPQTTENLVRQVGLTRNRVLWWLHRQQDLPKDAIITGGTNGVTTEGFQDMRSLLERSETSTLPRTSLLEAFETNEHTIGPKYKAVLNHTFLAVTANPSSYEGDHRFWEHIASGNTILSDKLYTPIPFALKPGVHYEEFNNMDVPGAEQEFHDKIHTLLKGGAAVERMTCSGLQQALQHHRSVSRVDYIMRTVDELARGTHYEQTGTDMRQGLQRKMTHFERDYVAHTDKERPKYLFSVLDQATP